MAGARLEFDLDDVQARQELAGAAGLLEAPQRLLGDIGEYLQGAVQDRFSAQQGPDGSPWTALTPRYKRRKKLNTDKILTLRGTLRSTIRYQLEPDAVLVGSDRKYAAIHQFGGTIDIAARSQHVFFRRNDAGEVGRLFVKKSQSNFAQRATLGAYTIKMPARPFLGISDADRDEISRLTQDHLLG